MAYSLEQKEEIFNIVFTEMVDSCKSVRKILEEKKKGMPALSTFLKWLSEDVVKSEQYARAMELRADGLFEKIMEIATTPEIGETEKILSDGKKEITKGDMLAHRRLQIDTLKWAIGKMSPKKYRDSLDVTSKGDRFTGSTVLIDYSFTPPISEDE